MALSFSSSSVSRASACRPRPASRRHVSVAAVFGGRDSNSEAEQRKQKQMEAQQAILEERRAKRDAFLRGEGIVKNGRVGPRSRARNIEEYEPEPPPPPKSKKERAQQMAYAEEEEEEEPAPRSNPLAGLLGGLFGKK